MNRFLITLLLVLSAPQALRAEVGISVTVGEPGFYGQLNIGGYPPPVLIYQEPVIIGRVYASPYPVYLRVPTYHRTHWADYCLEYGACNRPVYFVDNNWYETVYVPEYHRHRGKRHHHDNGHGKNSKHD